MENQHLAYALFVLYFCAGCVENRIQSSTSVSPIEIRDVGIVLCDSDSVFRWPLSDFGLSESDQIVQVNSSCDCVFAEIENVRSIDGGMTRALATTIRSDKSNGKVVRLGVKLELIPVVGSSRCVTLCFIHTPAEKPSDLNVESADSCEREKS